MSEIADIMQKDRCSWSEAKARASVHPVRSEPLLACADCEFWSERGEDWASCVANPIPFSTGIPGRFVQTRRDYLCAYGKLKANTPPCVTGAASDMVRQEGRP